MIPTPFYPSTPGELAKYLFCWRPCMHVHIFFRPHSVVDGKPLLLAIKLSDLYLHVTDTVKLCSTSNDYVQCNVACICPSISSRVYGSQPSQGANDFWILLCTFLFCHILKQITKLDFLFLFYLYYQWKRNFILGGCRVWGSGCQPWCHADCGGI